MSRHLRATKISAYLNVAPIRDLHDPNTPGPEPADESGRRAGFSGGTRTRTSHDGNPMISQP
jgi:hypothetical protein